MARIPCRLLKVSPWELERLDGVPLQLPRCLAQDSPLLQVHTVDILEQPYVL